MKRILGFFVVLSALAAFLIGCGGSGDGLGGGSGDPLESRIRALFNDVNQEDLNGTMSHFSDQYLNDCFDWFDVRDEFQGIFSTPSYSEDWIDLDVTFSDIQGDVGYAEGTFVIRTNDNGNVTEDPFDFAWDFVRENGRWVLIGNQLCNSTLQKQETSTPKKRSWFKGTARQRK